MTNIFVLGLEPFNLALLEELPGAEQYRFIELLSAEEAVEVEPGFRFDDLLDRAARRVEEKGPAHAIINYWDFPGCCLSPVLSRRLGLAGPDLEAVAKCEHKYWARSEMAACIPDMTPRYCAVDPFAADPAERIDLEYPYWLKPVVSHSSYLGFMVENEEDLEESLAIIRQKIDHFGKPFDEFLEYVDVPPAMADIHGRYCIAEEIISAENQVTLEGYAWNGRVAVVGWIDSLRESQSQSSFSRYDYPSRLPRSVLERMERAAQRLVTQIGYDSAAFNVEFFWDPDTDRISVLEMNSRISKSHCPLFRLVDGASHQQVVVDLALGRAPAFEHGAGDWPHAAKFMVRLFQDGEITRVPNSADMHYVQSRYPEARMQVLVKDGQRLSHLSFQDSYSFEIANIFFGGKSDEELRRKYADTMEVLPFEVHLTAPIPAEAP